MRKNQFELLDINMLQCRGKQKCINFTCAFSHCYICNISVATGFVCHVCLNYILLQPHKPFTSYLLWSFVPETYSRRFLWNEMTKIYDLPKSIDSKKNQFPEKVRSRFQYTNVDASLFLSGFEGKSVELGKRRLSQTRLGQPEQFWHLVSKFIFISVALKTITKGYCGSFAACQNVNVNMIYWNWYWNFNHNPTLI